MIHLAETIDFAPIDVTAVDILVEAVNLPGFKQLRDTTTRVVWDDLSEEVLSRVGEVVEELHGMTQSTRIRTTDVRGKLVSLLKNLLVSFLKNLLAKQLKNLLAKQLKNLLAKQLHGRKWNVLPQICLA